MSVQTVELFWRDAHGSGCKWRTARRAHQCDTCERAIPVGEQYLDTGEIVEPPWRTARLCRGCAERPMEEGLVRL